MSYLQISYTVYTGINFKVIKIQTCPLKHHLSKVAVKSVANKIQSVSTSPSLHLSNVPTSKWHNSNHSRCNAASYFKYIFIWPVLILYLKWYPKPSFLSSLLGKLLPVYLWCIYFFPNPCMQDLSRMLLCQIKTTITHF